MNWLMHECFPQPMEPSIPAICSCYYASQGALAGRWHLVAPCERCMVCPGVQDTRQQLQATQQQLEAELQDLATQVSTAEIKLAAEPAKQRALALQVLAITHASTQAKSKHCDLCFSRLCQQYSESCEMRLNAATTWHQTTHAAQRMRAQVEEVHTVSLLSVWSTCVAS